MTEKWSSRERERWTIIERGTAQKEIDRQTETKRDGGWDRDDGDTLICKDEDLSIDWLFFFTDLSLLTNTAILNTGKYNTNNCTEIYIYK